MHSYLKIAGVLLCLLLCSFGLYAQGGANVVVAGKVVDEDGEPLSGASVYLRGKPEKGTATDVNGYFFLEFKNGRGIYIEASFIGMKTGSVEFTGQKEVEIVLKYDSAFIETAVVKAHQNINDLDIRAKAGVVNEVDVKRMLDKPVVDLSLSLQGASPGLVLTSR